MPKRNELKKKEKRKRKWPKNIKISKSLRKE
jgi:hypothetical protein